MLVAMTKVRLVARRRELERVLEELHRLGLVELAEPPAEAALAPLDGAELRTARRDDLRFLLAEIDALLALLPSAPPAADSDPVDGDVDVAAVRERLGDVAPTVERLTARLDALHDEEVVLTRVVPRDGRLTKARRRRVRIVSRR